MTWKYGKEVLDQVKGRKRDVVRNLIGDKYTKPVLYYHIYKLCFPDARVE